MSEIPQKLRDKAIAAIATAVEILGSDPDANREAYELRQAANAVDDERDGSGEAASMMMGNASRYLDRAIASGRREPADAIAIKHAVEAVGILQQYEIGFLPGPSIPDDRDEREREYYR